MLLFLWDYCYLVSSKKRYSYRVCIYKIPRYIASYATVSIHQGPENRKIHIRDHIRDPAWKQALWDPVSTHFLASVCFSPVLLTHRLETARPCLTTIVLLSHSVAVYYTVVNSVVSVQALLWSPSHFPVVSWFLAFLVTWFLLRTLGF